MAASAIGGICGSELPAVRIFMAAGAHSRRLAENHIAQLRLRFTAPMATVAGDRAMSADQLEIGGVVIKAGEFLPGRKAVAGHAIPVRAIRAGRRHAF